MKKYTSFLGEKKMIKDQGLMRHEEIRRQIQIIPELEALIPPLSADEFKQLEDNIIKEGCREALLIWETQLPLTGIESSSAEASTSKYILIDGHNRYRICQQNQLDFKIHILHFDTYEAVREFMIDNQLGRRNLSPEQMAYLRGKKYNSLKQDKGKYDRSEHKGQNDPYALEEKLSTSAKLAKQFNVSEKTIKRDAEFAQGLDLLPIEVRKDVLSGKQKVKKSEIQELAKATKTSPEKPVTSTQNLPADSATNERDTMLRGKLLDLAKSLQKPSSNTQQICDDIIEHALQLKFESKSF